MERDCGATTNWVRSVRLAATDDTGWFESLSLALRDTAILVEGQDLVEVAWTGERELSIYARKEIPEEDVFKLRSKLGSVAIRLIVRPGKAK